MGRYDATLLQVSVRDTDGALYASVGAPMAHEDDAVRAVRAALELRDLPHAVQTTGIGLAQGIARTGLYGSAARRTYGVLGDAVNLAARLMQHAPSGQILASDRVWEATRGQVQWDPVPPLSVKGKQAAIPVARLIGALPAPRPPRAVHPARSPLVGRAAELAALRTQLDQTTAAHPGQALAISGTAGIGKSRLVEEVVHGLPARWQVMQSATQSYGTASPYLCWIPVWQQLFRVDPAAALADNLVQVQATLARLAPDRLPQLPLLAAVLALSLPENDLTRALDPRLRKAWLETMLIQVLGAYLAEQTTGGQRLLLVLEDLHWLDQLSADLLGHVVAAHAILPLTLVLTTRESADAAQERVGILAAPHVHMIRLDDLAPLAIDQLLTARLAQLGQVLNPATLAHLSGQIAQQAAGNPFYAEELIAYLGGSGLTLDDRRGWQDLELPAGLHRLVLSRVDRLGTYEQRVLKTASILGASFRRAWLADFYPALGGAQAVDVALATLEQTDLLAPSGESELCRFKHAITREVTYASLAEANRSTLHEQAAVWLEQVDGAEEQLDLLAYHYERSPNDAKAIIYLARSAARAASLFANADAVHQYQAALERAARSAVTSPLTLAELATGLGDVYAQMAEFDAALGQYVQAIAALGHGALERATIDLRRADVLVRATRFDAAMMLIEQTEASLGPHTATKPVLVILAQLANLRSTKAMRHGDHQQALEWAEQGLLHIQRMPNTYPQVATTRIRLYQSLVAAAAMLRDYDRAQRTLTRALRLIRRYPHPVVEGELQLRRALLALNTSNLPRAVRLFDQALPLIEATGTRDRLAYLLIPGGQALLQRGEIQKAREWLARGLVLSEETGSTFLISSADQIIGWLEFVNGNWDVALAAFQRGKQLAEQHELYDRHAIFLWFEAQIRMFRGDYDESDALFGQAMDVIVRHNLHYMISGIQRNRAYSLLMRGDLGAAKTLNQGKRITDVLFLSSDDALDVVSTAEWWAIMAAIDPEAASMYDPDQVAVAAHQGLVFLKNAGFRTNLPFACRVNAMVAYQRDRLDMARRWAATGVRIGQQVGQIPETARCLFWHGKTLLRQHSSGAQAIHNLQRAAATFRRLGAKPELDGGNAVLASALSGIGDG